MNLMLDLYPVVTWRQWLRCGSESGILSQVYMEFIRENDDKHIDMEGNIMWKSIATAFVFLH